MRCGMYACAGEVSPSHFHSSSLPPSLPLPLPPSSSLPPSLFLHPSLFLPPSVPLSFSLLPSLLLPPSSLSPLLVYENDLECVGGRERCFAACVCVCVYLCEMKPLETAHSRGSCRVKECTGTVSMHARGDTFASAQTCIRARACWWHCMHKACAHFPGIERAGSGGSTAMREEHIPQVHQARVIP